LTAARATKRRLLSAHHMTVMVGVATVRLDERRPLLDDDSSVGVASVPPSGAQ